MSKMRTKEVVFRGGGVVRTLGGAETRTEDRG